MKRIQEAKDAYDKGIDGAQLEANAGRVTRVLHWLGKRRIQSAERQDEAREQYKLAQFTEAQSKAQGLNAKAMQIVEKSVGIPMNSGKDPRRPISVVYPEGGPSGICWIGDYSFGPTKESKSRLTQTNPLTQAMPSLKIVDAATNSLMEVPVKRIKVTPTADFDESGRMLAVRTRIEVNPRPYFEDENVMYAETDEESAEFTIDASGSLETFSLLGAMGDAGFEDQDLSQNQVNIEELLEGVMGSVAATAQAYSGISGDFR